MRMNGQELRVCRAIHGVKMVKVSHMINRTPTAISFVENGTRQTLDELQTKTVLEGLGIGEEEFVELRMMIQRINQSK